MAAPTDARAACADDIWSVEAALGEPMGDLSVGPFVNDLLLRVANGGAISPGADLLRLGRDLVRPAGRPTREAGPSLAGRVLVTLVDDSPRIADLVLPVVAALGDRAVVLPARADLRAALPPTTSRVSEDHLGGITRRAWLRRVRRSAPAWWRGLRPLVRRGVLPRSALPAVAQRLVVQTRRALRYQVAFAQDRPDAVLVEYDRGEFAGPIVTAARSLGIPTATLVHGSVHEHGYTPLVADVVLCWGEAQADQLVQAGAPADRVVVTGCPRVGLRPWSRDEARAALGLDERPMVLVATNNLLPPAERLALCRSAFEAVAGLGGTVQVGLRIHPRESVEDYRSLLDRTPDVHLLGGDRASGDQVLAATDLLLCGITAFADEAAIAGVPSVVFDPTGGGEVTVGLGTDGPHASDAAELAGHVDRWARDPAWRRDLRRRTIDRGRALCATTGREAAARTADAVEQLIVEGPPRG